MEAATSSGPNRSSLLPNGKTGSFVGEQTSSKQKQPTTPSHPQSLSTPFAKAIDLWGFIIAVVVIGEFSGWNIGLQYGWSNCVVAFVLATAMYWLLALSMAEMSCSMPFSGGSATFAYAAFGHSVSAFSGLIYVLVYCIFTGSSLIGLGRSVMLICGISNNDIWVEPMLWILLNSLILLTNNKAQRFFRVATIISVLVCSVLAGFICLALTRTSSINWAVYTATPVDMMSVLKAFPCMAWFYLGVECIPVTAEECFDITETASRATFATVSTIMTIAIFLLALLPGLIPNIQDSWLSQQPVMDCLFNLAHIPLDSKTAIILSGVIMLFPIYAGGHGTFYVSARHIYALARAGYLPTILARTTDGIPRNANYLSAVITYLAALIFWGVEHLKIDIDLLLLQVMSWFGCLLYLVQMIVYIRLRVKMPEFPRPWKSPAGIPGAVICAIISGTSLFGTFAIDWIITSELALCFLALVLVFAVYFYFFARTRVKKCPEKVFISAQLNRLYMQRTSGFIPSSFNENQTGSNTGNKTTTTSSLHKVKARPSAV